MTDDRRSSDKKLRLLYVVIVVYAILLGVPVTQSVETSYHNCLDQRAFAHQYNGYLDQQVQNAIKSQVLNTQQKADRAAQGQHFHAFQPRHCSGFWPFQP